MTTPTVLTIGETMVQLTPVGLEPLATATALTVDIGGAESNVACHLVRDGIHAAWAGAVGDDPFGQRILATVEARGVDTSLVTVHPDAPTGVYAKDPRPAGTRVHYYRRHSAASLLGPDVAARLPLSTTPWVHLTGILAALSPSCDALVDTILAERARHGLPVSFDVNWRPTLWPDHELAAERLAELAQRCTIVFVGLDEAEALWGTTSPSDVRSMLQCETLIIKDEDREAWAWFGDDVTSAVPPPVTVVEPVGAGDAFAAGFLAAHIRGRTPAESLVAGHRRAASVLAVASDYDEK